MKELAKYQKDIVREGKIRIAAGGMPRCVVAENTKTGLSVLDNVPRLVCAFDCPVADKCYDIAALNRWPQVFRARVERHWLLHLRPQDYLEQAIEELTKHKPERVRIYGGGDYTPRQRETILGLLFWFDDITFYMISKTIRGWQEHARDFLAHPNFFLNLSEMADFQFGYEWKELRDHPRVNSVYTLLPHETDFSLASRADIVFNVSRRAEDIRGYLEAGLALCPCDAKLIPKKNACKKCGLCSTKGGVKWQEVVLATN